MKATGADLFVGVDIQTIGFLRWFLADVLLEAWLLANGPA